MFSSSANTNISNNPFAFNNNNQMVFDQNQLLHFSSSPSSFLHDATDEAFLMTQLLQNQQQQQRFWGSTTNNNNNNIQSEGQGEGDVISYAQRVEVNKVTSQKKSTKRITAATCSKKKSGGGGGVKEATPRKRKGKKDRHSKIYTAQGPRDRRMRLSLQVARKFFDLQDMLGFDKASKTVEWLFSKSISAIKEITDKFPKRNCSAGGPAAAGEGGGGGGGGKSNISSTSESEMVSQMKEVEEGDKTYNRDEYLVSESITKEEGKKLRGKSKKQQVYYYYNNPVAKESRDKARERARERTKEKMKMKGFDNSNPPSIHHNHHHHHHQPSSVERNPNGNEINSLGGSSSSHLKNGQGMLMGEEEDEHNNTNILHQDHQMHPVSTMVAKYFSIGGSSPPPRSGQTLANSHNIAASGSEESDPVFAGNWEVISNGRQLHYVNQCAMTNMKLYTGNNVQVQNPGAIFMTSQSNTHEVNPNPQSSFIISSNSQELTNPNSAFTVHKNAHHQENPNPNVGSQSHQILENLFRSLY